MDTSPGDIAQRHWEAALRHKATARNHDEAALYWAGKGDDELAELERRTAAIERAAAEVEFDRAELMKRRAQAGD